MFFVNIFGIPRGFRIGSNCEFYLRTNPAVILPPLLLGMQDWSLHLHSHNLWSLDSMMCSRWRRIRFLITLLSYFCFIFISTCRHAASFGCPDSPPLIIILIRVLAPPRPPVSKRCVPYTFWFISFCRKLHLRFQIIIYIKWLPLRRKIYMYKR